MNLKKVKDSRASKPVKVQDMDKSEQTDEVKTELFKLVQQFVRKYWRRYYPAYKGDIDDLISEFYTEFLTEKGRGDKKESLLDKFNPNVTTLPYVVKVAVQRMLIDRSRSDKGETNYNEKYDEETGELSLDYIANTAAEDEVQLEEIEFSDEQIAELRDLYDEMPEDKKKEWLDYYKEVKNVLSPNFQALFKDLVNETDWSEAEAILSGKGPDWKLTVNVNGKTETHNIRARHKESALQKAKKLYPEIEEITYTE